MIAVVAIPWFVLVTTGSAARAGIAAFATTLTLAIGAVAGGPAVDRLGVRRASIARTSGQAPRSPIPLLHALGALEFWNLVALGFTASAFEAPGRAARRALVRDVAERAGMTLERANSISTTSEHTGYLLGAPVAGIVITTLGAPAALWHSQQR